MARKADCRLAKGRSSGIAPVTEITAPAGWGPQVRVRPLAMSLMSAELGGRRTFDKLAIPCFRDEMPEPGAPSFHFLSSESVFVVTEGVMLPEYTVAVIFSWSNSGCSRFIFPKMTQLTVTKSRIVVPG